MEQPKNRATNKTQENIRDTLGFLGIAGETVTISPARTVEELVEMGLNKKYNTIVAIGSDRHINKIASLLQNKNCVLGIIPINASESIHQLIGAEDIKFACEVLKYRMLKEINISLIEPNKYFLTQAEIKTNKPMEISITVIEDNFDTYEINTTMTELIISRNLYIYFNDDTLGPGIVNKAWNWLVGKKTITNFPSLIRGKKIKIETPNPTPVIIDNEIVAKTPIVATLKPRALKIITKPARIIEDKKERKDEQTKN